MRPSEKKLTTCLSAGGGLGTSGELKTAQTGRNQPGKAKNMKQIKTKQYMALSTLFPYREKPCKKILQMPLRKPLKNDFPHMVSY